MKKKVILASFCRPWREIISGKPVFSHPSFQVIPLHWLRASALSDEEIDSQYDITICAFDMNDSNEDILAHLWEQSPTVVGFSCHMWNIRKSLDICRRLRIILPDVTIILGGSEASDYEFIFERNPFVDIIVLGEGEETFKQILRSLSRSGRDLESVAGICLNRSGKIILSEPTPPLNLEVLVSPYDHSFIAELSDLVLYGTSRGCSFKCKFCSWYHAPKRYFPIERVESELTDLLSNIKIKGIWFSDSEIDLKSSRTKRILNFIRENNKHNIKFFAFFNLLRADEDGMRLCLDANFSESPIVGLQSSNQKLHDISGRKWFSIKRLEKSLPEIFRFFPSVSFDVIYGLPGDNYENFKKTLAWCLESGIRNINFHRFMVTPGTEYAKHGEKYGIIFDRDVPHLSYSCESYSFEEIIKMETLANNFSILMSLLDPADYLTFKSYNIDLLRVMEEIHEYCDDWDKYFERKQEYGIEGIDANIMQLVKQYFKRVTKSEDTYRRINDLLLVRQEQSEGKKSEKRAIKQAVDPAHSAILERYARDIISPMKVNDRFISDWYLDSVSVGSGIVFAFKRKDVLFRIKLTRRDDEAPRLSHTDNFNIFYVDDEEVEKIPEEERHKLLTSFVNMLKKNDIRGIDHLIGQ